MRVARATRFFAAAALLALATAACRQGPPEPRIVPVFGTIVQVTVADRDSSGVQQALDRLEGYLRYVDVHWRSFGPGDLGQVNAGLSRGAPVQVPVQLSRLIHRSLAMTGRSGGLFDPRVGTLVKMWGFQDPAATPPSGPPADQAVHEARDTTIVRAAIHEYGAEIRSDAPVTLDLGSIAKGSALAGAAALLRAYGVENALINAGGDLIAVGARGDRPWRVGVRDPRSADIIGIIALSPGENVSSSGDYERFYISGPRRYHHIIDPRTGYPSEGTAGTTVVGRDAELAHVASTALMVAGRSGFDALAARLGIDCALLVTTNGDILMTPGMQKRLARPPRKV